MKAIYVITFGEIAFCPFFASIEFIARFSLYDIYGTTTVDSGNLLYLIKTSWLGGDWERDVVKTFWNFFQAFLILFMCLCGKYNRTQNMCT